MFKRFIHFLIAMTSKVILGHINCQHSIYSLLNINGMHILMNKHSVIVIIFCILNLILDSSQCLKVFNLENVFIHDLLANESMIHVYNVVLFCVSLFKIKIKLHLFQI